MILKKYFWLLNVGLVALFSYSLAKLSVSVVSGGLEHQSRSRTAPIERPSTVGRAKPPLSSFDIIAKNNVFNPGKSPRRLVQEKPDSSPESEEPEILPITELKMNLHGTAVADNPAYSYAVIRDLADGGKQKLVGVGSTLQGATVKRILWRKVILERNDREEMLVMSESTSLSRKTSSRRTPTRKGSGVVRQTDSANFVVDRDEAEKMITNINQFMTQLRVRPYFANGKPAGYLITDVRKGGIIDELGIKNGDILQSVNGNPVTRPEHAFNAYQQLLDESEVSLEVKRGPNVQVLTYQLK